MKNLNEIVLDNLKAERHMALLCDDKEQVEILDEAIKAHKQMMIEESIRNARKKHD